MVQEQSGPAAPQPQAPPTHAGAIGTPARPHTWPTTVGVIAIVFGAGGILGGIWGALAPYLTELFGPVMLEGQAEALQQGMVWTVVSSIVAVLLAVVLLFGGIRLTGRRATAPTFLKLWAVLKILLVFVSVVIGYQSMTAQFEAIQNDPNVAMMGAGFLDAMGTVGLAFGAAWGWALPVFVLIWFARARIKNETAGWA